MKNNSKKFCGYMSLFVMLFVITSTGKANIDNKKEAVSKSSIDLSVDKKFDGFHYFQNKNVRTYFIDQKPIQVDTGKEGWAVDILLED